MFKFTHETQELNLIIASLEHKIRDMQTLLNKMVAEAQAQAPKPPQPIEETPAQWQQADQLTMTQPFATRL